MALTVWFVRHGYAGAPQRDPAAERDRPLTPEGVAEAKAVAAELRRVIGAGKEPAPAVIFSSFLERALATADFIGKAIGVPVQRLDELGPSFPLWTPFEEFRGDKRHDDIMLVGHHDNIEPLLVELNGLDPKELDPFVTAEVRRLKVKRGSGKWREKYRLRPSDLGLPDRLAYAAK